ARHHPRRLSGRDAPHRRRLRKGKIMIGIGIIGAGHFGTVHARAMAEVEGVRLVASCREDEAAAAAFAREHGGRSYNNWRALLADAEVDVVLIATPHHLHEEVAIGAAEAGKHILL